MVRIPRSEPSLQPQIAMQPQASGSGWGAPGRALQGLGKSIASLGDVFEGLGQEQIAEQDFQDKMLMLKTDNELGLNQVETHASYQGNGDDYLPQRTEYYATTTNDAVSRMQPRNQQKGALFFEQRRGPYLERDAKFGGQRRQDTLIGTINDTVSTEYGKLATVPPEEFEQRFQETVEGVNAIIGASPLPDKLKEKVARDAAEQAYGVLNGLAEDPDTAPEIVPKILKMIEEQPEEIDGGALEEVPAQPEKGAEGVQGLPGSQSGPAPQRTSALEIQDFTAGRTNYRPLPAQNVKNIVLHDVSGNPKTRRLPSGGNIPHYHITFDDKGIYHEIPFDRQAPHARAFNKDSIGIAYIGFEGDKLSPQAVANGARAVQMVQQQFGVPAERVLTHPGAGPSATKSGKDPREAAWRGEVLAYLGQGGAEVADAGRPVEASAVNQRGLVQYAGLGGPKEEEVGAPRGQNKIPAEPQLVRGPTPVRVADASGRFVPQQKQNWRSVNSHLRDLLIKNSGRFKRLEQKAIRAQDTLQAKALKQEQQQTYDEGFDLWRSGKLTDQWIEEHRPSLAPNDDQKLFRILRNQNRFIDPETYADLLDQLDRDPQGTLSQAREDLAEGKISASFYDRIETRARREMKPETKTPGWAKRWMGEVREQIGTHQGDKWEEVEKSQAHMQDFEDYIQREIDAGTLDYDKVAKRAKMTVDGYRGRKAQAKRTTLSIPLELPGVTAETMTFEQLDTAAAKLKEDHARAIAADPLAKAGDPVATERIRNLFRERSNALKEWYSVMSNEAMAKGEKVPPAPWAKPMKLGGPKPEQGTVNQQTPQSQGVPGYPGSQSGKAPARQQPQQGESRPVGGALGVVPLAENPDGSVSLSVPGMILEPWRAFQRGLARESVRGMTDEAGNPLYDPKAQSEDAMTAASVPLAATSFGTAVGAVPKGALGSGMVRAGETAAAKEISPQGFYSGLDEALKGFQPTDSVTVETLAKRGVKKAEIEARGLSELLSEGKSAKVSDLQKVAGENRVEVREAIYESYKVDDPIRSTAENFLRARGSREGALEQARSALRMQTSNAGRQRVRAAMALIESGIDVPPLTKWSDYSLDPSNMTYRETVLHLPTADKRTTSEIALGRHETSPDFQSGHFSEPNIIAHARTSIQKDGEGNDVFVVNELQSDWGQKLDDDMKNAYAISMFGAKEGTGWEQTGRRISAYDQLTKEQKAEISKAIAEDRKAGKVKGGVRDESKIADLKARFDEAATERNRLRDEFMQSLPVGDRAKTSLSDAEDRLRSLSNRGDEIGRNWASRNNDATLLHAELRTAEAATPGHPLVNTTDQWVNTSLRRMITQAVESGADQIAIPTGETVKAFKMGGKEEGLKYAYDEMYPKNLRNILKKLDPSIEPVKVDHLYGQKGQKLERSKGFTVFKITPKLKESIKKEGQPLFSGGVPIDGTEESED